MGCAGAKGARAVPQPPLSCLSCPESAALPLQCVISPTFAQVSLVPLQGWPELFHTHSLIPCTAGVTQLMGLWEWEQGIQRGFSQGCTSSWLIWVQLIQVIESGVKGPHKWEQAFGARSSCEFKVNSFKLVSFH